MFEVHLLSAALSPPEEALAVSGARFHSVWTHNLNRFRALGHADKVPSTNPAVAFSNAWLMSSLDRASKFVVGSSSCLKPCFKVLPVVFCHFWFQWWYPQALSHTPARERGNA